MCIVFDANKNQLACLLTLHDLVHQTADKKAVAYFHTRTLFRVCHLMHYTTYVIHTISTVCLPVPSVGHWWDRQTGLFHYVPSFSDPSVMCSKDRKTDLFHCPVCLFQTGQADGPFSRSCLHVPSVRHRWYRQTGHFQCPICPVMFLWDTQKSDISQSTQEVEELQVNSQLDIQINLSALQQFNCLAHAHAIVIV